MLRLARNFVFSIVMILLFASLSYGGLGGGISSHNEEIKEGLRTEIHDLNLKIINSGSQNNLEFIRKLFVDEMESFDPTSVNKLMEDFKKIFTEKEFTFTNDYHVRYTGIGEFVVPVFSGTIPKFITHVGFDEGGEKFVSFMETKGDFQDLSVVFIYQLVEDSWRLYGLYYGVIRVANKTTIDWFEEASRMHKKGHLLPAILRLDIAYKILRPNVAVQYEKESEIKKFIDECNKEIQQYNFPITLDLKTKPQVFGIKPDFLKGELIPIVSYLSTIPFENESEIKAEGNSMLSLAEGLFPGVGDYSDYVVFKAYNELPSDPQKQYRGYGVVVETKKL